MIEETYTFRRSNHWIDQSQKLKNKNNTSIRTHQEGLVTIYMRRKNAINH